MKKTEVVPMSQIVSIKCPYCGASTSEQIPVMLSKHRVLVNCSKWADSKNVEHGCERDFLFEYTYGVTQHAKYKIDEAPIALGASED